MVKHQTKKTRLSRVRRSETPPPVVINKRDIMMFEKLESYRYLTTSQLNRLFFSGGSLKACQRRLGLLYHNAYLDRRFTENIEGYSLGEPAYFLDTAGVEALACWSGRSEADIRCYKKNGAVKPRFLNHAVAVSEFKLTVEQALQNNSTVTLHQWLNEYDIQNNPPVERAVKKKDRFFIYEEVIDQQTGEIYTVYPDSVFILAAEVKGKTFYALYFVEVDRGTETNSTQVRRKLQAYNLYFDQGRQYRYVEQPVSVKILFQTTGLTRMHNIINKLHSELSKHNNVLFTSVDLVSPESLFAGNIWIDVNKQEASLLK